MTHDQMSEQCTRRPDGAYLIESAPNYRQYQAAKAAREIVERIMAPITASVAGYSDAELGRKIARVRIKPLNLVGKIAGFAHVGCNGQMRVLVDRPHGQGVLRQHFDEDDLELVRE